MPINFQTIAEKMFTFGIDARNAETQIREGFVSDLINGDVVEDRVRKRVGYQGYAGDLPVRVNSIEYDHTDSTVTFTLDSATDLEEVAVGLGSVTSSPLVVYGRSTLSGSIPFNSSGDSQKYYPSFTVPLRYTFENTVYGTPGTDIVLPADTHMLPSVNALFGVTEASTTYDLSHSTALPHQISMDSSSRNLTISYYNSTGSDRDVFIYYKKAEALPGHTYIKTYTHSGVSGDDTISIPTTEHGLDDFSIITQIQEYSGTTYTVIKPDGVRIDTLGNVEIDIFNRDGSKDYQIILTVVPGENTVAGNIGANSTGSVTISTSGDTPWIFPAIYLDNVTHMESIYPNTITYSAETQLVTITFTNGTNTALPFVVYYDFGLIRSNRLRVVDPDVLASGLDLRPQLTIWGLRHSEIYGSNKSGKMGWVNYMDTFKQPLERRLISGLGGNIFSSRTYSESGVEYLYPLLHPNLQARTSDSHVLGPVLWDTGEDPGRTRGYITSDNSSTNWGLVTSVEYQELTGYTRYILSLPGMAVFGTPISIATGLEDWFTVQMMSNSRHEGTFKIVDVTYDTGNEQLILDVVNPEIDGSDWDDFGVMGQGGIFTDQIEWTTAATSPFISGDVLSISDMEVISSYGYVTTVRDVVEKIEIAQNILVTGTRSSRILPLREELPFSTPSVTNVVAGDMLQYPGVDRLVEVLHVNTNSNLNISITGAGGSIATVTLLSGNTSKFAPGYYVMFQQTTGKFDGVYQIEDILNLTQMEVSNVNEFNGTVTGILIGNVVEIDENLEWSDSNRDLNAVYVPMRWIPVEAPDDSFTLTPNTYLRHLDSGSYTDQTPLRSVMVSGNMYMTNGLDEVQKFDGTSIYRAGLLQWQPSLFISLDTVPTGKIVINRRSFDYTAVHADRGQVSITASEMEVLPVGSVVRLSGSSQTYTISSYYTDSSHYYVNFDRKLDSSITTPAGSVSEVAQYRYYFRLNAVDINNNIQASAAVGYQDHLVELTEDTAVNIRLLGMPIWDNYDYSRLEVQIYRTLQNQAAPYYLVANIPMEFSDSGDAYIDYTDTFSDDDLYSLDKVNSSLLGTEIGLGWSQPLRAKYITSAGNRLVLANIRDYPRFDIQLLAPASLTDTDFSGLTLDIYSDSGNTSTPDYTYEVVDSTSSKAVSSVTFSAGNYFQVNSAGNFTSSVEGDWIYLYYSSAGTSNRPLTISGWWKISEVDVGGDYVRVNYTGAPASMTGTPDKFLLGSASGNMPVLICGTSSGDFNLDVANGNSTFDLFELGRKLSMAINVSMVVGNTNPLLIARGGNDVGSAGRILLAQPRVDSTLPAVRVSIPHSSIQLFVNDVKQNSLDIVGISTKLFPSRLLVSYENYPEIFDNPTVVVDTESTSVFDINSADGQEVTGVLPFFGESAFGSSQQAGILTVFKQNSIYLVDINEKLAGRNYLQKIESNGVGCTAPYSIAYTSGGIMFANEGGIYCLRRNLSVEYLGKYMERNWIDRVNRDQLELCHGHHYPIGGMYKLSVPLGTDEENSEVYVYSHVNESQGKLGAWSRYTRHFATGWANLDSDAFHSSTSGRVFSIRKSGTETDYRDSGDAIEFRLDTRHLDFGNSGIRKVVGGILIYYRTLTSTDSNSVKYSIDTGRDYIDSTSFTIDPVGGNSGLGDVSGKAVVQILHNTSRSRFVYLQVRVECTEIDKNVEIAGMDFNVGALTDRGLKSAEKSNLVDT